MTHVLSIVEPTGHLGSFQPQQKHYIAWVSVGAVLLIGILGILGIILDIPRLYDWDLRGMAMNYQAALALAGLAIGHGIQQAALYFQKVSLKILASVFFLIVLIFGLTEISAFILADPTSTLQEFLAPHSPLDGHISFYAALGIFISALASLFLFIGDYDRSWASWIVQLSGILLLSLASFGFAENLGSSPTFRFLVSIPSSLGLFFYGVALLFFPLVNFHLRLPFYTSGSIRIYTVSLCLIWLVIVFWQAVWANAYLGTYNFTDDNVHSLVVIDELFEVLLSAIILGLGLHILSSMEQLNLIKNELLASNSKLENALDSIGMLSSTLSHDLKTPIKIQMNTIEMLKSGRYGKSITDETVQEMLTAMLDSKQFEHELVLNLIDLMRYKMQEERFVPKDFEIQILLKDIQKDLEPLAERKHQRLIIQTESANKLINADYFGMKRLLHNLVNNAIQHLDSGCQIEVSVQEQTAEYVFRVQDNGPGIPTDVQENLFNRFNRVSSSGLGLYITRQIVTRHSGKIWVESTPGEGSTFAFSIPR